MKNFNEIIKNKFTIENELEVDEFIKQYPFLQNILVDFLEEVNERFKNNIKEVQLMKVEDPEIESETRLFAYIYTDLTIDEAIEKMDCLDTQWLFKKSNEIQGKFNYNVRFVY